MSRRPQSSLDFEQALLVLDSDATDGLIINGDNDAPEDTKHDGIFQLFVEHSSDVNLQMRVPAPKTAVGTWTAAGDWKTVDTIDADSGDTMAVCSGFEYRFTTATAGARVFLGVQYEGVS